MNSYLLVSVLLLLLFLQLFGCCCLHSQLEQYLQYRSNQWGEQNALINNKSVDIVSIIEDKIQNERSSDDNINYYSNANAGGTRTKHRIK